MEDSKSHGHLMVKWLQKSPSIQTFNKLYIWGALRPAIILFKAQEENAQRVIDHQHSFGKPPTIYTHSC